LSATARPSDNTGAELSGPDNHPTSRSAHPFFLILLEPALPGVRDLRTLDEVEEWLTGD